MSPQGGDGDLPPREQAGWITSSPVNLHRDVPVTKARCSSQEISLRLVFAIATESRCQLDFSLFLTILSYTILSIGPCFSSIFSRSTRRQENQTDKYQILPSLFCTSYCSKSAQNDAHQQDCFERLEIPRTLTRQWKYCGL